MMPVGVAVDVGNFAIKARVFQSQGELRVPLDEPVQVSLQQTEWLESFARWYAQQLAAIPAANVDTIRWRVATVNPPPTRLLKTWIETRLEKATAVNGAEDVGSSHQPAHHWHEVSFRDVPLNLDIRRPETVGIDRLIAAWAAWRGRCETTEPSGASHWGFVDKQREQPRPVIVVDAGSAMTVDLVDAEGTFHGGAILPGRQMQFRSLGLGAFALPDLSKDPRSAASAVGSVEATANALECPGRDTQAAIQLGVFAGMVGAVDHLRTVYRKTVGGTPELVLTGGDACLLAGMFGGDGHWVPHLLLDGLAWL